MRQLILFSDTQKHLLSVKGKSLDSERTDVIAISPFYHFKRVLFIF